MADKAPGKSGHLILVIEDEPDHLNPLVALLEKEGYEVSTAGDGLVAIERLRWGLRPAAILLDMRMPGMNGWEFRRELARDPACASTPVLIMSGAPLKPGDVPAGADWIAKPIHWPDLLRKLDQCIRSDQARTKPPRSSHEHHSS